MSKSMNKSDDKHDYMPRIDDNGNPVELVRVKRSQHLTIFQEIDLKEKEKKEEIGCFRSLFYRKK